jgi:hypothetical protein
MSMSGRRRTEAGGAFGASGWQRFWRRLVQSGESVRIVFRTTRERNRDPAKPDARHVPSGAANSAA